MDDKKVIRSGENLQLSDSAYEIVRPDIPQVFPLASADIQLGRIREILDVVLDGAQDALGSATVANMGERVTKFTRARELGGIAAEIDLHVNGTPPLTIEDFMRDSRADLD